MKTCIIIHCWEGYPEYCWYPWAKSELEKKGFKVIVPGMPETTTPTFSEWFKKIKEIADNITGEIYLVGHSLGCITILRYLEQLPDNKKVDGVVMVAGFTDYLGYNELESFFQTPINFKEIKQHCNKFIAINSDNDPYVSLSQSEIFKKELDAKVIVKHQMGHFSGKIEDEKSCLKLPAVVDSILEISAR